VYCDPATGPTPHIQAGTITGYAITSKKRVATLPNVPTSAEAGVPAFDVTTWYGMYAPRNTPKPIVDALVDALQKALKDPTVISRFAELSMEPVAEERATPAALEHLVSRFAELSMTPVEQARATPEALESFLKAEVKKWDRIIKDAGITPQ
jgi:tripartite-type tricarboxylate transporter receptor subunit TctC